MRKKKKKKKKNEKATVRLLHLLCCSFRNSKIVSHYTKERKNAISYKSKLLISL